MIDEDFFSINFHYAVKMWEENLLPVEAPHNFSDTLQLKIEIAERETKLFARTSHQEKNDYKNPKWLQ